MTPQPIAILMPPRSGSPSDATADVGTEAAARQPDDLAAVDSDLDGGAVGLGFDLSTAMLITGIVLVVTTFRIRRRRRQHRRGQKKRHARRQLPAHRQDPHRYTPGVRAESGGNQVISDGTGAASEPGHLRLASASSSLDANAEGRTVGANGQPAAKARINDDRRPQPPLRLVGGDRWADDGGADLPASSMQSAEQRLVALDEHARAIICTLENRVQLLEALLDVADQRIRTLERLTADHHNVGRGSDPDHCMSPATLDPGEPLPVPPSAEPVARAEHPDHALPTAERLPQPARSALGSHNH